ncbi:MAG: YjfB family protein [Lachnospiraceae bacterium]|nr:YjfB family protein [Lachnospiraceae bacterium]
MDIPSLSMAMSQSKVLSEVGTAVLSKTLDTNEAIASGVVNMIDRSAMELSVNPNVGSNFDVSC